MSEINTPGDDELVDFTETIPKQNKRGLILTLIAGLVSFGLFTILPYDITVNKGLALLCFVGILWLTEALHIAITALLVPILAVFLGFPEFDTKKALVSFADPIIFVFFGGFALATALHVQQLDKKIALWLISLSKGHFGGAVSMIFGVTAFLSMWISNTATAAMMLPLALGMLTQIDKTTDRNTHVFVLLGIAYSASIGGLGTLVGSPPNAIAAKALELDFAGWMKFGLPMMIVLLPTLLGAMYLVLRPNLNRRISLESQPIPWTLPRVLTILVFVLAAVSWIFGKQLGETFGFKSPDTVVALTAAVAVVGLGLVSWKQVSDSTDWGVLMLFGGGITLSVIMEKSGASLVLGEQIANTFSSAPEFMVILVVSAFIIMLTEFTSNTASAALLVPVFATIAVQMGMPVEVMILIIGIGASCAFMMPVATPPNAIVMGTGDVTQRDMMRVGAVLNAVAIIIVALWAYLFLK
ncbi:SLC13 family permease [Moraxella boevrei]|uniref:SLC13 family permease n=1 Tax=Faucicola boevrei TaxID=346665 RepID=UPI00373649CF